MAPRLCHNGVMDLTAYPDYLRNELLTAAEADGDEARAVAERFTVALQTHGDEAAFVVRAPPIRAVPGTTERRGHIRLLFADEDSFSAAARIFDTAARDTDRLTLYVPSEGSVPALRAVLAAIDEPSIDATALPVYTHNLDDAFRTVTGRPDPGPVHESTRRSRHQHR